MLSETNHQNQLKEKVFTGEFFIRLIIEVLFLGILVAIAQKYIDSRLASQTAIDILTAQNKLNSKKEVYFEAISILNRYLSDKALYLPHRAPDTANRKTRGTYPTEIEINNCFAKLCIYSDNSEIPTLYRELLTDTGKYARPILKMEQVVNMMRDDLGNGVAIIDTVGDRYKYIIVHHK